MTQAVALAQQASTGVSQGFKNRIINGAMVIDQRNAGASVTVNSATDTYSVDRFPASASGGGVFTMQRSATSTTSFSNSLLATVTTADSSIAAGDFYGIQHKIEGYNTADFNSGTANAKTITLSFWVRSSVTGTYGLGFGNNANNRWYPTSYSISSANTWEQKSITLTCDTSGTWDTTNGTGLWLWFDLGSGSSFQGTANAWTGSTKLTVSGATQWIATNGATFYITGVQLEVGSTATSFDYRPYGTELALCQRYYQQLGSQGAGDRIPCFAGNTTNAFSANLLITSMRSQPTLTVTGAMDFDQYYVSGFSQSSANVARNSGGTNSVVANFGNYSGLSAGRAGGIYGNTTGVLQISAEL